jgi:PEP-CTERM motif
MEGFMFSKTSRRVSKGLIGTAVALAAHAASAQTLPPPGTFSVQFDDFYSYSTRILDYAQPTAGWNSAAGTGLLDVIITTRSAGQTNSAGALAPYNIPDPITNVNTSPIVDSWGMGGTSSTTMRVLDLYNYLQTVFNATVPVFTFDQNETGANPALQVTAKVEIFDGIGGSLLALWSLDNLLNGAYDPLSPVTAPGTVCTDPLYGEGAPVCFNNNVGSGRFDYIIVAPTMDLTPFADADNVFKVSWAFADVDDGGEEITLTGRFTGSVCPNPTLPQCQTLPEPGTLALGGLGLLGLAAASRRRWSKRG